MIDGKQEINSPRKQGLEQRFLGLLEVILRVED